jgi:hypothetical protein
LVSYQQELDAYEHQVSKLIRLGNKKPKPLYVINDDRRLHENLKILEEHDSDDSDDRRNKQAVREQKKAEAKPYRTTYQKLKKRLRQ